MNYFSFIQLNSFRNPARVVDAQMGSAGSAQIRGQSHNHQSHNHRMQLFDLRPRCLMLVLFVVGVSICVSSGFSLFVEYQDSCTTQPDISNSEEGSSSPQQVGNIQGMFIPTPEQGDTEDSYTTSCPGTEIAGTLLIKYLFFLLGLCIALCTLACAVIFLTHGSTDGRRRRCCFCCPNPTACINRMRTVVGLAPLLDESTDPNALPQTMADVDRILRRVRARGAPGDSVGRSWGGSTPRSGRLWSPRELPVFHGVLVQQPHMCNSSDSIEGFSKSPNAVVVGVCDSVLSTFAWSPRSPLKKSLLAPGHQPPPSGIARHASNQSSVDQSAAGSSSPQHAEHSAGHTPTEFTPAAATVDGASNAVTSSTPAACDVRMQDAASSSSEVEDATSGSVSQCYTAPDEQDGEWTHHHNSTAANSSNRGPAVETSVPTYPEFSSTIGVSNSASMEEPSGVLAGAATHGESPLASSLSAVATLRSCEPRELEARAVAQQVHSHVEVDLEPERSAAASEPSMVPSAEHSAVPSVCGLASENTMHDLGAELSMEPSVEALATGSALGDVSAEFSMPELCLEDSAESTARPQSFEFPKQENHGQHMHELLTPRINLPSDEQQAPQKSVGRHSGHRGVASGAESSEAAGTFADTFLHRSSALQVPRLPLNSPAVESTSQLASGGEPSLESSFSAGPLVAVDSRLTAESSLPEGMSSDSALSGGPSGLSAGYSFQSIIRGAVSRFAE